jgi:general secretion pathway protein F
MKFDYLGVDAQGRRGKGQIDASDDAQALQLLEGRGLTVLDIAPSRAAGAASSWAGLRRTPARGAAASRTELLSFMRELATLLRSGVSLDEALQTLHGAKQGSALEPVLLDLVKGIHAGDTFSSVLERAGLALPGYAHALARAGEATGDLGTALARCADQMDFDARLRSEASGALIYPAILLTVGVAAVLFIFSFVVPKFAKLLQGKRADLPWLSEVVLDLGLFVNQHLLLLGLAGCALLAAGVAAWRAGWIRALLASIPGLGAWVASADTARWTSTLAVLIDNRVPILQALELTTQAAGPAMGQRIAYMRDDVRNGVPLSQAMQTHQVLDGASLSMVKVGERSGELGAMLGHVANYWQDRSRTLQRRLVALIEPASIVMLGAVIGVVMVAIILAITSLTEVKL